MHLNAHSGRASVRCGDLAGVTPPRNGRTGLIWADVVSVAVRLHRGSSPVGARFSRDISARVSLCVMTRRGGSLATPSRRRRAVMRLRSGKPAGCRPGRYEKRFVSIGDADITFVSRGGLALRACRPGDARPIRLQSDFPGSNVVVGPFALAGNVIATALYRESPSGAPVAAVHAVDLSTGRGIGTIKPKIRASAVAVSSTGVLACIERPSFEDNAPATLLVRRLDGRIVTLDSSLGNGLSGLRVEGTTVSWLHDGAPRSSSVA